MEETELIREFLIESGENLSRLDREMVDLERNPGDGALLASIFRTIHTIKGTCGFLNFTTLETITHQAENILGQIRNGQGALTQEVASIVLETVDAIKAELTSIEAEGRESGASYADLLQRQQQISNRIGAQGAGATLSDCFEPPQPAEARVQPAAVESRRGETGNSSIADSTIRVDVALLNRLMNLVGELVLARNQILQFSARLQDGSLNTPAQKLNLITSELQEGVMRTRMQPIGNIWGNLPRVVRDLATSCGKQIDLLMDGADTELDKTIIEAIKDPLTHIVRNACDHGIETPDARVRAGKPTQGRLMLSAFHEGGNVNIEISDDGAGIEPQRIKSSAIEKGLVKPERAERMSERELANLVFLPGLSTAKEISSISGRGVGMDVVKTNIEKIGGTVDLAGKAGHGTTVKIKIPLTLAIIPGLVVTCAGERFVIPQVSLLELVRLEGEKATAQIEQINGTPVYRRRGHLLPLARLNEVLQLTGTQTGKGSDAINIVILQAEERQFGLIVDEINDTQEIVVKPLGSLLKGIKGYAGATIMGDGRVALILDVLGIAHVSGAVSDSTEAGREEQAEQPCAAAGSRQTLLLFRAGPFERLAVPLSLVARLEEFSPSAIEKAAGGMVVQYRGQILPLVPLASQLGGEASDPLAADPVLVVVFANGDRRAGIIVDRIIDIIEDTIAIKEASAHPYLLGSAVTGGKVTDFLDMHAVTQCLDRDWSGHLTEARLSTVLLTEDSPFSRGLVRSYLEMAGHRVIEASNCGEAIDRLSKDRVTAVMTALDLPDRGAFRLAESVRSRLQDVPIPVIALNHRRELPPQPAEAPFSDCLYKFDRVGMLRSLDRLARAVDDRCAAGNELVGAGK